MDWGELFCSGQAWMKISIVQKDAVRKFMHDVIIGKIEADVFIDGECVGEGRGSDEISNTKSPGGRRRVTPWEIIKISGLRP